MAVRNGINQEIFQRLADIKTEYENSAPFPHCRINDLFDSEFLGAVKHELMNVKFFPKDNDLYKFYQADTLEKEESEILQTLKAELFSQQWRAFLEEITGMALSEKPDLSSSLYSKGHTLLCHDDQVHGRNLAFVLYLVDPEWSESDGGCLDIFTSENGLADKCVRSLVPQWNSLVIFEVSSKSFHQVSEVLSDRKRLTVHGWFHGIQLEMPDPVLDPPLIFTPPLTYERETCEKWLSAEYQKSATLEKLNEAFCSNGMIELKSLLKPQLYAQLVEEIKFTHWKAKGPLNRRKYEVLKGFESAHEAPLFQKFHRFLCSSRWKTWLSDLMSIELLEHHTEIRKFSVGSYSLLHDLDRRASQEGVDVCFSLCNTEDWMPQWGGYQVYTDANDAESEVCTSDLEGNKLVLVFRDAPGFFSFVKYVNQNATGFCRVDVNQTWKFEAPDNNDEEEAVQGPDMQEGTGLSDLMK